MARGLPTVYGGQEGSGAAWVGPRSTYDPVAAAKTAFGYAAAKKKNEDATKAKTLSDLAKGMTINGPKILDQDMQGSIGKNREYWITKFATQSREQGWIPDQYDIMEYKREDEQYNKTATDQRDVINSWNSIINGGDPEKINQESMKRLGAIYLSPTEFMDDPIYGDEITKSMTPIIETLSQDPKYSHTGQLDEEWVKSDANMLWRANYGRDILQPVSSPMSLLENFNKVVVPAAGQYTQAVKNGGSFGSEVSNMIERVSGDDQTVTIDGVETTIYGLKTSAGMNYVGDKKLRKDVLENFLSLEDTQLQKQYLDNAKGGSNSQKMNNAAFQWYVNEYGGKLGQKAVVKQGNKEGTGTTMNFGGSTFNTESNLSPTTVPLPVDRIGVVNADEENPEIMSSKGEIHFVGWNAMGKNSKPIRITGNSGTIYDRASESWKPTDKPLEGNYIQDYSQYGVAPALGQDINLNNVKYEKLKEALSLTINGEGEKGVLWRQLEKNGFVIKAGTPLTKDEELAIWSFDPNLIKARAFAGGSMTSLTPDMDQNAEIQRDKYSIPGVLRPLNEVNTQMGAIIFPNSKNTPYTQLIAHGDFDNLLAPDGKTPYARYNDDYSGKNITIQNQNQNGGGDGNSKENIFTTPNGNVYDHKENGIYYKKDGSIVK